MFLSFLVQSPAWAEPSYSKKIRAMAKTISSDIIDSGKTRIAVANITSVERKTSRFGKMVAEKLNTCLVQASKDRFDVLERSMVDRIMGERVGLSAEEAQKLLNADILVTGTYTVLEDEIDLSLRAIDLATAKAVAAANESMPIDDVRSLLDSQESAPLKQKGAAEITLNLQMLAFKYVDGREREVVMRSGDVLHSGDEFKINFEAGQDCYLYILYYDSTGQAGVLFPNPKIALDNNIKGGVKYALPGEGLRFYLDENVGTEQVYFVASIEPMNDITKLLADMERTGGADRQRIGSRLRSAMGYRGIGIGSETTHSTFGNNDRIMEVVKGCGSVLKTMEIRHR